MKRLVLLLVSLGVAGSLCASGQLAYDEFDDSSLFPLQYQGGVTHLGKVDEGMLLADLNDFLYSMPFCPAPGQTKREFENFFVHELFVAFPTFILRERDTTSLIGMFRTGMCKPDVRWIELRMGGSKLSGCIARLIMDHCEARWNVSFAYVGQWECVQG